MLPTCLWGKCEIHFKDEDGELDWKTVKLLRMQTLSLVELCERLVSSVLEECSPFQLLNLLEN